MAGWGERERQRKRIHRHIGIILPLFVEAARRARAHTSTRGLIALSLNNVCENLSLSLPPSLPLIPPFLSPLPTPHSTPLPLLTVLSHTPTPRWQEGYHPLLSLTRNEQAHSLPTVLQIIG